MDDRAGSESARFDRSRGDYREALVRGRRDVVAGPGYLYRPGEVIVASQDVDRVREDLERAGSVQAEPTGLDLTRFQAPAGVDVPELVATLRRSGGARVGPNHVLIGEPKLHGGPSSFAWPADAPGPPAGRSRDGYGVVVAVLDTGIAIRAGSVDHPFLAVNCSAHDPVADAEEMDSNRADGNLDDESGHGTFIAGIILQLAPAARVVAAQVLESDGVGDEVTVARRMLDLTRSHGPDIINLSLGGYTVDDLPPLALAGALGTLPPEVVVVAAAGNDGLDRPFWPAAFDGVLSVGALECSMGHPAPHARTEGCSLRPAPYSNRGPWVKASAVGDWRSTFFRVQDPPVVLPDGTEVPARAFEGWARWAGTSFAAPAVAGAIAARMSRRPMEAAQAAAELLGEARSVRFADLGTAVEVNVDA